MLRDIALWSLIVGDTVIETFNLSVIRWQSLRRLPNITSHYTIGIKYVDLDT